MNTEYNQNYQLDIEAVTPVYVGAGKEKDWMKDYEFIYDDGFVYVLDLEKLYSITSDLKEIQRISSLIVDKKLTSYLKQQSIDLNSISKYVFELETGLPSKEIKTFIRNGMGKTYLPGSSIKGAVKSVLFNELYKKYSQNGQNTVKVSTDMFLKNKREKAWREIEENTFGKINTSLGRLLRITDGEFNHTKLMPSKINNRYGDDLDQGWKHALDENGEYFDPVKFVTIQEVMPIGEKSSVRFSFAEKLLSNFEYYAPNNSTTYKKQRYLFPNSKDKLASLFKIINRYTKEFILKEIDYFEDESTDYHNKETSQLIESFRLILKKIPNDNSYAILRMSAGSSFHGMTGDWRFNSHLETLEQGKEDHLNLVYNVHSRTKEKALYKSRKFIFSEGTLDEYEFYPPGFIKLSSPDLTITKETEQVIEKQEENFIEATKKVDEIEKEEPVIKEAIVVEEDKKTVVNIPSLGQELASNIQVKVSIKKVGTPHSEVCLMIDGEVHQFKMSGTKKMKKEKSDIAEGDEVLVELTVKEGSIRMSKYIGLK
ncbi:type III-A CRISPR-associated RAMP protein Csm5 [Flammeovirga sp. SJP92]|uniref:type III-A CRISPR-associated RAMP protein Csm5 n=1 Tax=Flammeovirga sp. SJP92 TaxID=1775430 RepID=UPI000788B90F|nr:type III-A CRISPR-associated RAMP protein Csm5 [Flammeovirga sp. SJP92]KXX69437.1 hypothetical protein AVL50_19365 [Flammeovirga sp. SJP92]